MIPSDFQRGALGRRGSLSPATLVVAGVVLVLLLIAVWVLATMNSKPTLTPVSADVAVNI